MNVTFASAFFPGFPRGPAAPGRPRRPRGPRFPGGPWGPVAPGWPLGPGGPWGPVRIPIILKRLAVPYIIMILSWQSGISVTVLHNLLHVRMTPTCLSFENLSTSFKRHIFPLTHAGWPGNNSKQEEDKDGWVL